MGTENNVHVKKYDISEKVKNWTFAGIPQKIQAQLAGISLDTLRKYYKVELQTGRADIVAKVADCAAVQALEGSENMQRFILKMLGGEYGWQDKQVIEQQNSDEVNELMAKVKALESEHDSEY